MTPKEAVAAVRALHTNDDGNGWGFCNGCDEDMWPCPTAEIVYTKDEIADIDEARVAKRIAANEAQKLRYIERDKEVAAGSPPTLDDTIRRMYDNEIRRQLFAANKFDKFFGP